MTASARMRSNRLAEGKLIGAAIAGMLSGLDARSAYINEAAYRAMQTPANDDQASLGLVVTIENGQLKVISPQDGSPAAQAGIKPGDLIFAIDKDPTYDLTLGEAEQKLRGPAGSEVELSLRRDNRRADRRHGQARALQAPDRDRSHRGRKYRLSAGRRVRRRNAGGAHQCGAGFAATGRQQADRLYPRSAKQSRRQLSRRRSRSPMPSSTRATSSSSRAANPPASSGSAPLPAISLKGVPIVALINGGTAREAELVAAGLQDNRRAVLLGTKSFGESSIESLIPLQGNGAIRLTTARFMTPSGQRIQGKGLDSRSHGNAAEAGETSPGRPAARGRSARRSEEYRPGARGRQGFGHARIRAARRRRPSLATADIGSAADEQLSEAADVLRGLALVSGRAG